MKAAVGVMVLLGTGWVLGVFMNIPAPGMQITLQWLFILINASQVLVQQFHDFLIYAANLANIISFCAFDFLNDFLCVIGSIFSGVKSKCRKDSFDDTINSYTT